MTLLACHWRMALLGLWITTGCLRPLSPQHPPPVASPAKEDPSHGQPESLTGKMRSICRLLTGNRLSAVEAANRLGGVKFDYGGNFQVEVRVSDAAIAAMDVGRSADTGVASSVNLRLRQATAVSELQGLFGPAHKLRQEHWNSPTRIAFATESGNGESTCVIIATFESNEANDTIASTDHVRQLSITPR